MTSTTISFRVDAAERQEIAGRAARDKVSLSDYIRVRLGLRAEGSVDGDDGTLTGTDEGTTRAQLADHERRLAALEADRAAVAAAGPLDTRLDPVGAASAVGATGRAMLYSALARAPARA